MLGYFSPVTRLHDLSALEQAAAVRAGEVSPTELVEHYLARIAAHDAAQRVLDELGRAHLPRPDGGGLFERGEVVQRGHGRRR